MERQNSADATHSQNKSQKITISLLDGTSLADSLEKTSKTPGFKSRSGRSLIKINRNSSLLKWTSGLDLVWEDCCPERVWTVICLSLSNFTRRYLESCSPLSSKICLSSSYKREWMLHKHIHFSTHFSQSFLSTVSVKLVFFNS